MDIVSVKYNMDSSKPLCEGKEVDSLLIDYSMKAVVCQYPSLTPGYRHFLTLFLIMPVSRNLALLFKEIIITLKEINPAV